MATTATDAFDSVNLSLSFASVADGSPGWLDKLTVLERFNGQTFLPAPARGAANDSEWRDAA